jgi:hypothetical protein
MTAGFLFKPWQFSTVFLLTIECVSSNRRFTINQINIPGEREIFNTFKSHGKIEILVCPFTLFRVIKYDFKMYSVRRGVDTDLPRRNPVAGLEVRLIYLLFIQQCF